MLSKKVKYVDFEGNEREEVFYFNLTKAESLRMEFGREGTLSKHLERIVAENDNVKLYQAFEELVLAAYGEKSEDGKRFVKSEEIRDNFKHHAAYSEIVWELASNEDAAIAFVEGIVPVDLESQ